AAVWAVGDVPNPAPVPPPKDRRFPAGGGVPNPHRSARTGRGQPASVRAPTQANEVARPPLQHGNPLPTFRVPEMDPPRVFVIGDDGQLPAVGAERQSAKRFPLFATPGAQLLVAQ